MALMESDEFVREMGFSWCAICFLSALKLAF